MGAKTSIAAITPSATHVSAAEKLGRHPTMTHNQALRALDDAVIALRLAVADATLGNSGDSNIATLNTIISNLS
jgi:hypothetical protein